MHKTKAIIRVLKRKPPTPGQVMRFDAFLVWKKDVSKLLHAKLALSLRLEGSEWCNIDSLFTSPILTRKPT